MDITTKKTLNNGVQMPILGYGVFLADNEETERGVLWALEAGYRHIDTAAYYGNEKAVGKAVKSSGLKRNEVFVTTKLWNQDQRDKRQREAFEKSLDELGLEYVDLYLIHWPVSNFPETWNILEDILKSGKAKAIGVSNFQPRHLDKLAETATVTPAVNQVESHPLLTQKPLIEYCAKKGIACQAWSPLGGKGARILDEKTIKDLADKHGRTPAQIVLRWDLQRGITPLPKSVHQERIISNARLFDFSLGDDDMAVIDAMNKNKRGGPDPDHVDF